MALVKVDHNLQRQEWGVNKKQRLKLPKIDDIPQPTIDYEKLRMLCNIDGLKGRDLAETTQDAHDEFIRNYDQIFAKPPKKSGYPNHSEKRSEQRSSNASVTNRATGKTSEVVKPKGKEFPIDTVTHDIRDYMPLLHKQRKSEDPEHVRLDNLRTLRKLLRKLPFERSLPEIEKIFSILQTFDFFKNKVPSKVLRELCVVGVLEQWKEPGFTVFGKAGLHMVLRGAVKPITNPYLNESNEVPESRSVTPLVPEETQKELVAGDCFGTLTKVKREQGSKIFSVVTVQPNCEFLKISSTDYMRVIEQIKQREHTEKVNLLLSCGQYQLWPKQPVLKVAELIEWMSAPPNSLLVSEKYKAPYIGFIKSGVCHVLKQVEVMHTHTNGKREKKTKQVVVGKLKESQSFSELSVLLDEPIDCTILTDKNVELGIIRKERITELDDDTKKLFQQSAEPTFGNLKKSDIQEEYMNQKLKSEWSQFKRGVVMDVINSRGIRPGYGKWSMSTGKEKM
ncbi:cyclic nucleotide-binding domain-containing protein 1-like [Ostrea edulis]|uniref:cyclic nucleotide-binding domain-containing protein 1-like n=1 Tax=Ostrea edulis TaxID=37623 RepID=UPI0024AF7D62|nr:cyclic nucleotide-binding domain-containing protein 1-like [Ostrea edulis]